MLLGIKPCISPELLYTLARMGHGDEIVIVDAFYPSHSKNTTVIRCDGTSATEVLDGIMSLMNPDSYVDAPVVMMKPDNGDPLDPQVEADFRAAIDRYWPETAPITRMERQSFLTRSSKAFAIVQTGETRKYGNVILTKGVIPVANNIR